MGVFFFFFLFSSIKSHIALFGEQLEKLTERLNLGLATETSFKYEFHFPSIASW